MINRVEIKKLAQEKIVRNKWNIIWPVLIIEVLSGVLVGLFGGKGVTLNLNSINSIADYTVPKMYYFATSAVTLLIGIVYAGYFKYIINFVRTGKFDSQTIIDTVKKKWLDILIAEILMYVIISLCTILFVIPGIIMSFAYAIAIYLVVDTKVKGSDSLKESREMMRGYKWDYFVFCLSFIGWILLIPLTLGLILIWLYPYMITANVLYYEKLKELHNDK